VAEHENCIGESDEWYTPPSIFDALGMTFDLDPCSPGPSHWVPARKVYTKEDDGLSQPWNGTVFMNPPFGGRNGHVPWLTKFFAHRNGIAVVRSYTSSDWWHRHMHLAEALLWPRGKTKFIPSPEHEMKLAARQKDGVFRNAPGHGIVLVGMGRQCTRALEMSGLGMFWDLSKHQPDATPAGPVVGTRSGVTAGETASDASRACAIGAAPVAQAVNSQYGDEE
jgi:hypothetical protein